MKKWGESSSKWDDIFGAAADQMRPFNDFLIYDFRREKINQIPEYLNKSFYQVMEFYGNQMQYIGYRTLTPEEHIEYLLTNQLTKGSVQIRATETSLVRYEFLFHGRTYYIYIDVPYLINERVVYNDTEYFPQFPIVEKGGVNRTDHGTIIVKVMRVPIIIGRRPGDKMKITSVGGQAYPELLVTVRIHRGATSGKKGETTPLVLYHFCKYGYRNTMKMFHMDPDDVSLSNTFDTKDPKYEYFVAPNGEQYLKVSREALADCYKRRMILSLYRIFSEIPEFTESDAFGNDSSYYRAVLGRFIGSKDDNKAKLLVPNANKHILMTDPLLDLVAKDQLKSVHIEVDDVYQLLYWMYYNIDDQIVSYDPTDLSDKKIEGLDSLACVVTMNIATVQYGIINSKKAILDERTVEQFCKRSSQRPSWITSDDTIFRPNPARYNDNFFLSIGMKRYNSMESVVSSASKKNRNRGKTKTSPFLLRAHPSQLYVTSILDIPASNPVVTGSMNPYCQIDKNGNIIRPDYADEIQHVFD